MVELRCELQRVMSADSGYDMAPLRTEALCQSDVERIIIDCISARRYSNALQCVRYYGFVCLYYVLDLRLWHCCIKEAGLLGVVQHLGPQFWGPQLVGLEIFFCAGYRSVRCSHLAQHPGLH